MCEPLNVRKQFLLINPTTYYYLQVNKACHQTARDRIKTLTAPNDSVADNGAFKRVKIVVIFNNKIYNRNLQNE